MNAFSFLDPVFVSPVAEIERGFLKSPKSYVLVVSKKSLQKAVVIMENDGREPDAYEYDEDDDETNSNEGNEPNEILFFDVHQDAAKWLLDASFNAGFELLKRGNANLDFRLGKLDLAAPPRGEGATMASIFFAEESHPRIFSFESSIRRDVFLRSTRSFGDRALMEEQDEYYYDENGRKRKYRSGEDDEDEDNEPQGLVVWNREQYQIDKDFEASVVPARGVLSVALSSNDNNQNQAQSMTQAEEVAIAREMIRNPLFNRGLSQCQHQTNNSNNINNSNYLFPAAPAKAPTGIFALPLFQAECANKIASTDIKIASLIVNETDRWLDMLQDIQQLDEDTILHLEARIENFSHELLSRKSVIDDIAKDSLMRQQIKKNLSSVIEQLQGINAELCFTSNAKKAIDTLMKLQLSAPADLESNVKWNTSSIESGTETIESVLASKRLIESKYSKMQAISDRCEQFTTLRRDIARRVRTALVHTITNWAPKKKNDDDKNSVGSATASSREPQKISLLPPTDLFRAIEHYSSFMQTALRSSDLPGYYCSIRCFAKKINEMAVPQIGKFFLELRRRISQMPTLADLRYSTGRQMNFDVDDFVSSGFVLTLYNSCELSPSPLMPSVEQILLKVNPDLLKEQQQTGNNPIDSTFGGNSSSSGSSQLSSTVRLTDSVFPSPEFELSSSRDSVAVLGPVTARFKHFFALLADKETRKSESFQAGLLARLFKGGEDPWACRADVALAVAAKAVTDLVLGVRNFLSTKFKLMSADPSKSEGWVASLSANSSAFHEANPDDEANDDQSVWDKADEVNTFLWLCFRRAGKNNLQSSSAMEFGMELIRLTEFIFSRCDLLFAIPIASVLESVINRIDDGDSTSSKPIAERGNHHSSTTTHHSFDSSNQQQQAPPVERSGFLSHVLAASLTISLEKLNLYIALQIQTMRASARKYATTGEKVENILPSFLVFPVALNRIETLLNQQFYPSYSAFELFLNAIVPQMFTTLDAVTFRDDPSLFGGDASVLKNILPAQDSDFIQFVHHSLFCVAVRNAILGKTKELLRTRLSFSEARRDQYEQRYILRSLFAKCFPQFAATAEMADGIIKRTINEAEADSAIRNMFDVQKITKLCEKSIPEELPVGLGKAKESSRRHVARLVSSGDLAISHFLRELVKTSLDHLLIHLRGSLALVERVRTIVAPTANPQFYSSGSKLLQNFSSL